MFYWKEEIDHFRQREWYMDCVSMKLTQNIAQAPKQFIGHGYFRQREDGSIAYRIYPTSVVGVEETKLFKSSLGPPGVIISADRYFRLEAVARNGTCWEVEETIPDVGASFIGSTASYIVGGVADEMRTSRKLPQSNKKFALTMMFFEEVEFLCNASTETSTNDGEEIWSSSKLDTAKFQTNFGDFQISGRPGMVVVKVLADNVFPQDFETRITEALMLVFAKPLSWNIVITVNDDSETFRVRAKPKIIHATQPRPIFRDYQDIDMCGELWRLFKKYLDLVCMHSEEEFHPCSRHLYGVLEASAGGITAWGLSLGVAVEGIVKEMFPEAGTPIEGLRGLMAPLTTYCLNCPEIPAGQLGDSVKKRLQGMIGQLPNISAKDKLYALAKEKIINEAQIKSWSELRNSSAHGASPGSFETQKLLDLCYHVTVLMYHLIFKASGYEGMYEDYSTPGWPTKQYPLT